MKLAHALALLLGLALLLLTAPQARTAEPDGASPAAAVWDDVCVDCPPWFQNMTERSLQIDDEGRLHLAFGGDQLYYARSEGAGWQIETVPLGQVSGVGAFAALALDGAGRPHITFHDGASGALGYAWYDGADWQAETVALGGHWYGHGHNSLALDGLGRPHVSFYDYDTGLLRYARRDAAGWLLDETFAPPGAGEYSSLALDGLGRPHVVYWNELDGALRYVWHDGTSWQYEFEAIESDVNLLGYPALLLDGENWPHVAYVDGYQDYDLRYARRDADGWHTRTVDDVGGWYPALALDGAGNPHISYYVAGELRYAWGGTSWQIATLSNGVAAVGWGTALALDPAAGLPHIVYRDEKGALRHTWLGGTVWRSETVARSRDAGQGAALAVDGANRPHVSYSSDGLRYALLDGTAWQVWTVDAGMYVGGWTSLAFTCPGGECQGDEAGLAHVSYHDWSSGDLKYARHNGTVWMTAAVDQTGYVGEYSSLALDSLGQPHISYFDRTNSALKYARLGGTAWLIETVPLGDQAHAGMYSSLAVDGADQPHITCEANGDLLYVWRDGAAWQVETVDEQGVVGRYSSLALDGAGLPHVSYYDATNADLKYAWRDQQGAWRVETVLTDTLRRAGRYSSLALDALGRPHVSFYDETGGDLGYAWRDVDGWQVQTVATGGQGDVGWYSSLAVDGDGQVHVSYYDAGARDLRYARQASGQLDDYGWRVYLPLALRRD